MSQVKSRGRIRQMVAMACLACTLLTLTGCIVEPIGGYHRHWWYH